MPRKKVHTEDQLADMIADSSRIIQWTAVKRIKLEMIKCKDPEKLGKLAKLVQSLKEDVVGSRTQQNRKTAEELAKEAERIEDRRKLILVAQARSSQELRELLAKADKTLDGK